MDTHLTTIGATLEAIERLHASAPSSSKNTYRPFTCAVLNTYKLDVLDYIRDADQVEANLFWYPPVAGNGTASSKIVGEVEAIDETAVPVTVRIPEPKEFVPPTPLRKTAREAESKGLVEFNARTLLKAAQRLLDNYHQAPRARKHIRTLLKRHNEFEKQTKQYELDIAQADKLIERLSNPQTSRETAAALLGSSKPAEQVDDEVRKLQDAIRNEKMEILAIEQTTEDLLEKRQRLLAQRARQGPPVMPRSESLTPTAITPQKKLQESLLKSSDAVAADHVASALTEDASYKQDGGEERLEDGDATVREVHEIREDANTNQMPPVAGVESSDELERICENIWSLFGENLRYVAVDREGANYEETLGILEALSLGGKGHTRDASHDESTLSFGNDSQTTAATTGSSASSQLENAGPPQPAITIASHVLRTLLMTPPPHVMDIEDLKAEAESWWDKEGREVYLSSTAGREGAIEIGESTGSDLASRAVFRLVAKKILRLQFRGAKRIISFPAHIG